MSDRLCLSLNATTAAERAEQAKAHDFIELRTDLPEISDEEIKTLCKSNRVLIADRIDASEEQRLHMLEVALTNGAAMVDMDVASPVGLIYKVGEMAKKNGAKFIVSAHDFDHTPSRQEMKEILDEARSNGPDYIKLATYSNSAADNSRMVAMYTMYPNLIAFCMGTEGRATRVVSLALGAPFTYVSYSADDRTAPGQLDLHQMKTILGILEG